MEQAGAQRKAEGHECGVYSVCVCVCGVYMHSMRSDRDRERGLREIET